MVALEGGKKSVVIETMKAIRRRKVERHGREGVWVSEGVGRSRRQVYYIAKLFVLTPGTIKGQKAVSAADPP